MCIVGDERLCLHSIQVLRLGFGVVMLLAVDLSDSTLWLVMLIWMLIVLQSYIFIPFGTSLH